MPQKPRQSSRSKGKGFKLRPLPEENGSEVSEAASEALPSREPFENLGELPHGYGVDTIFLIAQEPHWLFTYWDIDITRHPGGAAYLRHHLADGTLEGETEVPFETRNWYIPVRHATADYFVEIGFYRGTTWNLIARSMTVTTPPEGMSSAETFDYATVPFHLSFQRLLDHLETSDLTGEDLLANVARLQQSGDLSAFAPGGLASLLTNDQRAVLRSILGDSLLAELIQSSGNTALVQSRVQDFLSQNLHSPGASETLHALRESASWLAASPSSGEFSASSSEIGAISSWAAETISSWGAEFASWSTASGVSSGEFTPLASAGLSSSAWASFLGSSWAHGGLTSWAQAAASSWTSSSNAAGWSGGEAGLPLSELSSWLQGSQSSWAAAALSSWNSPEISSWFQAESLTSWGGSSEQLSSASTGRDFFMHVNAEVIFYGGTDPQARVTIDGKPVALNADGTFRHHFVFPNADYQIPIIAVSPDGVETRSATLVFHRGTQKAGVVTDTPQPPLGEPMGAIR